MPKNSDEAFSWFNKAAIQNYGEGQFYLGLWYFSERQDSVEACKWFLAATTNNPAMGKHGFDLLELEKITLTNPELIEAQRRADTFLRTNPPSQESRKLNGL